MEKDGLVTIGVASTGDGVIRPLPCTAPVIPPITEIAYALVFRIRSNLSHETYPSERSSVLDQQIRSTLCRAGS